jgi:hypothetical protein
MEPVETLIERTPLMLSQDDTVADAQCPIVKANR